MSSLTRQIIEFTCGYDSGAAPATALHILKLSLLDWCAVALAGQDEPVSQTARAMVNAESGNPQATVIGQSTKLPARAAALANGATSHALDYDDTHFLHIAHPSVAIFPAALAVAEQEDANGLEFLTAALVGYEASCRIGHWLGRSHYEAGFHQTATAGCFGATLAACRILNLNQTQTAHALGIASTRASGLKSQFGTMGKPFNAGIAASNGVEVALLAARGFISNPDGLESFAATHAAEQTNLGVVLAGLGETFVLENVQHKFHACCHGLHAALEALSQFIDSEVFGSDRISTVTIHTHPRWLSVCNNPTPMSGLEAKFSYRLTAAMCLAGLDTGALEVYSAENCADPHLTQLRDRVMVESDAKLPDSVARISVESEKGHTFQSEYDLNQSTPASEREQRVRGKARTLVGARRADTLWSCVNDLESAANLEELSSHLQGDSTRQNQ